MSRIDNSLFQMQILLVDAKKRNAHDSIVQAFEDSVKALKQQPCEDCISRDAVDEYITNLLSGYLYDEERTRLEDLTTYIWELPPVIPKPCEDAISRAEVLKILEKEEFKGDAIYEIEKKLPSVQPTRPTGKWEYVQYDYNPNIGNWHCSECRFMFVMSGVPEYKYCPNCGAKMEGKA